MSVIKREVKRRWHVDVELDCLEHLAFQGCEHPDVEFRACGGQMNHVTSDRTFDALELLREVHVKAVQHVKALI